MLNRVVTGDESWVRQYQTESKCAAVQWKHHTSLSRSTKKFKVMGKMGKLRLLCFEILREYCQPIFRSLAK
jgi:hypothetical protein